MGWLNFNLRVDPDGKRLLEAEVNDAAEYISRWSIESDVKAALVRHYTQVWLDKFADQITNEISPQRIMEDAREAFRENLKEKLKGSI